MDKFYEELFQGAVYVASREYHESGDNPGKYSIEATKPLLTQDDLALAYSPGVAAPSYAIYKDPSAIYRYTTKRNTVAVVSDGSAVLGLGNIGAKAALPVMEGKAVLFKKFSGIDAIPIIIESNNVDEIVNSIALISSAWAGINLEDISSPRCFEIERLLQERLDIPVFHDDQHGTAIVSGAALINALDITGLDIKKVKMVINGAGAAGLACLKFFILLGIQKENVIICDREGVVYNGRKSGMDVYKAEFAAETTARTLTDAINGANIFVGLSAAGALTPEMLKLMAPNPIIFAMANPEPEIRPEIAKEIRKDIIIATGRSDYHNQVNNVMGFPYIFRGALDVRATRINDSMKLAAAHSIAKLAREPVHDDVFMAYSGRTFSYGPEYIIPVPFDPRLMSYIAPAVAAAASESGVARKPVEDIVKYKNCIKSKLDPAMNLFQILHEKVQLKAKTIIFAEGEEENVIRAAVRWADGNYGEAILVGDKSTIEESIKKLNITHTNKISILNSAVCKKDQMERYIDYFYNKTQRKGMLKRDCIREVKTNRNIFASCVLACEHANAMITGLTRSYHDVLQNIKLAISHNELIFGLSAIITKGRVIFIADSAISDTPDPQRIAAIAVKTAKIVRAMGQTPRVAIVSYATFGNPFDSEKTSDIKKIVKILRNRDDVDFEWDGEMSAEVALNKELLAKYPFSTLTQPANILIMPGLHAADISQKLIKSLTDAVLVGPILIGFEHSVQIVSMSSSVSEILNMAVVAASKVAQ